MSDTSTKTPDLEPLGFYSEPELAADVEAFERLHERSLAALDRSAEISGSESDKSYHYNYIELYGETIEFTGYSDPRHGDPEWHHAELPLRALTDPSYFTELEQKANEKRRKQRQAAGARRRQEKQAAQAREREQLRLLTEKYGSPAP